MKKKFLPRLLLVLLIATVVVACSFDSVVGEVFVPPAPPVLGESITFEVGETINVTNGTEIVSVKYDGVDEYGQSKWLCLSMGEIDCAEKHSSESYFFLNTQKIGETTGNTATFVTGWTVIK